MWVWKNYRQQFSAEYIQRQNVSTDQKKREWNFLTIEYNINSAIYAETVHRGQRSDERHFVFRAHFTRSAQVIAGKCTINADWSERPRQLLVCTRPCASGCWIELKRELTPGLVCRFSWTQRIVVVLGSAICLHCLDSGKCEVKNLISISVTYCIKLHPHLTCQ